MRTRSKKELPISVNGVTAEHEVRLVDIVELYILGLDILSYIDALVGELMLFGGTAAELKQ